MPFTLSGYIKNIKKRPKGTKHTNIWQRPMNTVNKIIKKRPERATLINIRQRLMKTTNHHEPTIINRWLQS